MNLLAEFELPGLPKTVNQIGRSHWAIKSKEAKRWKSAVFYACHQNKISELMLPKATLELTRFSSREPDVDNMVGSWKHVIDGLVLAQVIIDDKPSVIGSPVFTWEKCKRAEARIRIRIFTFTEDPKPDGKV